MKKLYVLQHSAAEPLGVWEDELKRWYARYEYIQVWKSAELPKPEDTLAAIVLGGPMSANDVENNPFIPGEIQYLQQLIQKEIHVIGICLGAQLVAASLGAKIYNGRRPEVGYSTVTLTHAGAADPLMLGFPIELPVLQWHEQGFELPQGAVCLAGNEEYPNQAFRFGKAFGMQFHLEVTPELVGQFGDQDEEFLRRAGMTRAKLAEQIAAKGQVVSLYGRQVIRRFWDSVTEV